MKHLYCFGMGYSAQALARRLSGPEWEITGTARSENGCSQIENSGFNSIVFDGSRAAEIPSSVTHLLISIPPDEDGDIVLRYH